MYRTILYYSQVEYVRFLRFLPGSIVLIEMYGVNTLLCVDTCIYSVAFMMKGDEQKSSTDVRKFHTLFPPLHLSFPHSVSLSPTPSLCFPHSLTLSLSLPDPFSIPLSPSLPVSLSLHSLFSCFFSSLSLSLSLSFSLPLRGAGTGGLGLAIEGPSEAKMSCKDNKDGSCSVEYIPFTPGDYDVNITFGGLPIPGLMSLLLMSPAS